MIHTKLLWPKGPPLANGKKGHLHEPRLTSYHPSPTLKKDVAILICPGGGYCHLAVEHEGHDIAKWLNTLGITAYILEYRMSQGGYYHPVPLMDVQHAMRTVRHEACQQGFSKNKIGILGFSAGGHLASTCGTQFDYGDTCSEDKVIRESCRPDFMILCYSVISFSDATSHQGSVKNLLGNSFSQEALKSLSSEKQVTSDTPPTFLFHTDEDEMVEAENSVMFYLSLRQANVPSEIHVYSKGPHGVGLATSIEGTHYWTKTCEAWLKNQKIL